MQPNKKLNRKAKKGGTAIPFNLLRNWAHQGFFYLDKTEKIWRIIFEIVPTVILFLIFQSLFFNVLPFYLTLPICLLIVHTLNWIFNDNWWACVLFAFPWFSNAGEEKTISYLNSMASRLKKNCSISGLLIFGSVARGDWHDRSDLDMRLLRRPGLVKGMHAYGVLVRERVLAVFSRQPLDIYLADGIIFLQKMRKDEPPIFLIKNDPRLDLAFPSTKEVGIYNLKNHSE